ncbi:hypothetical protein MBLNU230_g5921t1 [Neophaeotheca triangularis]
MLWTSATAAPGFGFSFGDIVQAIALLHKASKALKASGAASNYQLTVIQLDAVARILDKAQTFEPTSDSDRGALSQITLLASSCRMPLQRFQNRISKYEDDLDHAIGGRRNVLKDIGSTGRKVRWVIAVEKQVAELKASIELPIQGISFWPQWCNLTRNTETHLVAKDIWQKTVDLSANVHGLRNNIMTSLTPMLPQLVSLQSQISEDATRLRAALAVTQDIGHETIAGIASQESTLQMMMSKLDNLQLSIDARPTTTPGDMCANSPGRVPGRMTKSKKTPLTVDEVLDAIASSLKELLLIILFAVPVFHKCLKTFTAIVRDPSWLLLDNVHLEDAIGRKLSLPYEHFRHWPVVEARLNVALKDSPGEALVRSNYFCFINLANEDIIPASSVWETLVERGMRLAMSMLFRRKARAIENPLQVECPRCQVVYMTKDPTKWNICPGCKLEHKREDGPAYWPANASPSEKVVESFDDSPIPLDVLDYYSNATYKDGILPFERVHIVQQGLPASVGTLPVANPAVEHGNLDQTANFSSGEEPPMRIPAASEVASETLRLFDDCARVRASTWSWSRGAAHNSFDTQINYLTEPAADGSDLTMDLLNSTVPTTSCLREEGE